MRQFKNKLSDMELEMDNLRKRLMEAKSKEDLLRNQLNASSQETESFRSRLAD